MIDSESQTYYEVLELDPDASPQDIRAAYLRAKAAYKKDSVALYTLISPEETEQLLRKIEEAFLVLSSPESRRDYDRSHGILHIQEPAPIPRVGVAAATGAKVVSIDRVPPMDSGSSEKDLLVPPTTDFFGGAGPQPPAASQSSSSPFGQAEETDDFGLVAPVKHSTPNPSMPLSSPVNHTPSAPASVADYNPILGAPTPISQKTVVDDPDLLQHLTDETEWRGTLLRKVRDARKVSLEEMCDYTKITKTYLLAIEDENYEKLPAGVYLRGFVTQIAKYLRLPHDRVAAAYMGRHAQWRQEKEKQKR